MGIRTENMSVIDFFNYDRDIYQEYIFAYEFQDSLGYYNMRYKISFDKMVIRFNPNRIFLYQRNQGNSLDYDNNIVFERVKCIVIDQGEAFDRIHIICGDAANESNDIRFTLLGKK